jgi:RES domain-containing protein
LTVRVWRIATESPNYGADDLSGEGARITGGRWNRPGTSMIYASRSIALACLETIAHLNAGDLPLNRYLVSIKIPKKVWEDKKILNPNDYVGWDAIPAGITSLEAGNRWVKGKISALFLVPSIIVPEEKNVLINPDHPEAAQIKAEKQRRWTYDSRLHPK